MNFAASASVLSICKDAAGVAGNIFAFGLFVSPMPTFRRIIRNKSTEQFSGFPTYLHNPVHNIHRESKKVFGLFAIVVAGSLHISDLSARRICIGFLSGAALISMFASPLLIIKLVIRTRSVEFMPFYLSLSTFLMSTAFFLYGIFNFDPFIYVPNGIGAILGIVQLALFFYYKNTSGEASREPLLVTYT
ncbi:bidirectional sugar transporter SWEET2-like isoform X4 [Camellia sinensis]|uniref:bidirectional sugar transporter SWEET2-like isoform X4 n=1 Tax=Camellia sinensis TaxID=4442 RepID=UPI001036A844|nr:bidirectional sugar transporter SWEET2-like isoform X4 [Camellia sinensis]